MDLSVAKLINAIVLRIQQVRLNASESLHLKPR
jgi:hypothetical protein